MNHQESFSTRLAFHVRQKNLSGYRATGENCETLRTGPVHDSQIKRDRVAHNFQVSQFTSPALDQHHLPSLLRLASADFSPLSLLLLHFSTQVYFISNWLATMGSRYNQMQAVLCLVVVIALGCMQITSVTAADPDPVLDNPLNLTSFTIRDIFHNGDVSSGPGGVRAAVNTRNFPATTYVLYLHAHTDL